MDIIAYIFVVVMIAGFVLAFRYANRQHRKEIQRRDEFLKDYQRKRSEQDAQKICPHCQSKGTVTTRYVQVKKGVSGGKLTAAFLTLGLSLFAVGLSRRETPTEARCSKCGSVWHF
jgi:Flp pilus assembly protein TadB